jgi:hypothetical protein
VAAVRQRLTPRPNNITVACVRHADVSPEAEVFDVYPPEFSLREDGGFNHRDCEEREPCLLVDPFD